ncbi:MAG: tetratricopeptide repeat protein [Bacteroidetes bacterium]|nr:tetratricopeptide repeat protein [Bacteroidota bacterium]
MHRYLILLLFFITGAACSQESASNSQLALIYFQNKDFEKAAVFYKELFEESNAKVYFDYYIKCLIELGDFDTAEKYIRKQIKKSGNTLLYTIEMGSLYKQANKPDKATELYETVIKKMTADQNEIIQLANNFLTKQEFEWAEKVYLQAKKLLKEYYTFSFELANVYYFQRNYTRMIDEYLDLLDESEGYIQSVQNRLQNQVYDNIENNVNDLLKSCLLKRIQKHPDKTIFSDLLIWLYVQEKEFENAFNQSKALDKRNKEGGDRLMALGNIAASNQAYDVAINCYKYVIDKGPDKEFYISAKSDYLSVLYQKIVNTAEYSVNELSELESTYISTLSELGENTNTFTLIYNLAHIQAFYLSKADTAINMLEKTLKANILKPSQVAECKTELADILLFADDPWQATLYYAQVEKANKDMPIGHEAKFKKAKLAYFMGDFKWAQAQLDVLKASTSKLIANDALDLALLISENTDLDFDTADVAMRLFGNADYLFYQNQDTAALRTLDCIIEKFSSHPLADEILHKKYEIMYKEKKFQNAAAFLQNIIDKFPEDILADRALYKLAELNELKLGDSEKAKELYKNLMTKYPGSIYVAEARKHYRKLRGDNIE